VAVAGLPILAVALIDWHVDLPLAFGFLYLAPILLVGTVWPRSGILATAALCTLLSHVFAPPFPLHVSLPEDFLVLIALSGIVLFAFEISRTHARELANARKLLTEREQEVLQELFEGLTNEEIAAQLGVSESAVKATLQ
jgi:hypothetical protein